MGDVAWTNLTNYVLQNSSTAQAALTPNVTTHLLKVSAPYTAPLAALLKDDLPSAITITGIEVFVSGRVDLTTGKVATDHTIQLYDTTSGNLIGNNKANGWRPPYSPGGIADFNDVGEYGGETDVWGSNAATLLSMIQAGTLGVALRFSGDATNTTTLRMRHVFLRVHYDKVLACTPTRNATSGMAPFFLSCHHRKSGLGNSRHTECLFLHDFGDTGRFDRVSPVNGLHYDLSRDFEGDIGGYVYTAAGSYTHTTTITDKDGNTVTDSATITVSANTRTPIYVGPGGNDANDGSTSNLRVLTASRVSTLAAAIGSNVHIIFVDPSAVGSLSWAGLTVSWAGTYVENRAGATFTLVSTSNTSAFTVSANTVVLDSFVYNRGAFTGKTIFLTGGKTDVAVLGGTLAALTTGQLIGNSGSGMLSERVIRLYVRDVNTRAGTTGSGNQCVFLFAMDDVWVANDFGYSVTEHTFRLPCGEDAPDKPGCTVWLNSTDQTLGGDSSKGYRNYASRLKSTSNYWNDYVDSAYNGSAGDATRFAHDITFDGDLIRVLSLWQNLHYFWAKNCVFPIATSGIIRTDAQVVAGSKARLRDIRVDACTALNAGDSTAWMNLTGTTFVYDAGILKLRNNLHASSSAAYAGRNEVDSNDRVLILDNRSVNADPLGTVSGNVWQTATTSAKHLFKDYFNGVFNDYTFAQWLARFATDSQALIDGSALNKTNLYLPAVTTPIATKGSVIAGIHRDLRRITRNRAASSWAAGATGLEDLTVPLPTPTTPPDPVGGSTGGTGTYQTGATRAITR